MQHGGDLGEASTRYGRRGGPDGPPWLDLSTGINPHPWPIPPELRAGDWSRLPARADLDDLIAAAREAYGVADDLAAVAAPGTQALIGWLPRLAPPGDVAILGPTYAEHAAAWRDAGASVSEHDDLRDLRARHAVVVQPNNPDGRVLAPEALLAAAERCGERGGWLVVDESFADLRPEISLAGRVGARPVVILRSFGKFYGLAGLRLGFAIAPPAIAARIEAALGPWAVAAPALAVGRAALRDRGWANSMRDRLGREAAALDLVLAEAGLTIVGGTSLYRLCRHPRATEIHAALAERRIWTRRFDWDAGLLRVGLPPDEPALARLQEALCEAVPAHDHGTTTGAPSCSAV